jgi:hypothetical protein
VSRFNFRLKLTDGYHNPPGPSPGAADLALLGPGPGEQPLLPAQAVKGRAANFSAMRNGLLLIHKYDLSWVIAPCACNNDA